MENKKTEESMKKEIVEQETKDLNEPEVHLWKMIGIIGPEWILVLLGFIAGGISGIVPLAFYWIFGNIVDALTGVVSPSASIKSMFVASTNGTFPINGTIPMPNFPSNEEIADLVNENLIYCGIVAVGGGLFTLIYRFLVSLAEDRMGNRIKQKYFEALVKQEIAFFDRKKSGELVANITENVQHITSTISMTVIQSGEHIVRAIAGLVIAFTTSWRMSLITVSVAPILLIIIFPFSFLLQYLSKKVTSLTADVVANATEIVTSMRTVRSMGAEEKEKKRFSKNIDHLNKFILGKSISGGSLFGLLTFCLWCDVAVSFLYGGYLISWGYNTLGDVLKVFGMVLIAVVGIVFALSSSTKFSKAIESCKEILKVIERVPAMPFSGGKILEDGIQGDIEFKDVNFKYPTRDVQVLNGMNLSVKKGQTIALVGGSGCGKSTIIALLEKFYEHDSGHITIDGNDIRELDPQWLHKHVGIVTQEPVLFADTIKNNILYSVDNPSEIKDEQIIEAAKIAYCHDFIMKLPKKYNTILGERGVTLSGGQKQRVAIARAIIQNPKILLLDEATSALDTESEKLVQDALDKLMVGRTCIIVAHRLATVRNADKIFVIEKGKVIESGTHEELIEKNGHYANLALGQMIK